MDKDYTNYRYKSSFFFRGGVGGLVALKFVGRGFGLGGGGGAENSSARLSETRNSIRGIY